MKNKICFSSSTDLFKAKGKRIGHSNWYKIDQTLINEFAKATGDNQWIHVDKKKAAALSPYKNTIAHGYLTLSLLPKFANEIWECSNLSLILNYGSENIRFITPVVCNDDVRAVIYFEDIYDYKKGILLKSKVDIEIKNKPKIAMSAITLSLLYFN